MFALAVLCRATTEKPQTHKQFTVTSSFFHDVGLHWGHPADARRDQLQARFKLKNGSLEVEKAMNWTVGWPVGARRVRQTGTSGPCQSGAKDQVSWQHVEETPPTKWRSDRNSPPYDFDWDAVAQ